MRDFGGATCSNVNMYMFLGRGDTLQNLSYSIPPSQPLALKHVENRMCNRSGLAYFSDVAHYLVWMYLSYDRETCTTDEPFGRVV